MNKYSHITFEGKHEDEIVLYFSRPSKVQTIVEISYLLIPAILVVIILSTLYLYEIISFSFFISILVIFLFILVLSLGYKIYRVKHNFLYITSKRVLFHGMRGLFKDYVKKISYDNIRNVNYFTDSVLGKFFNYGTLEIQSSHGGLGDISVYNIHYGKMLTHYIDKLIHLDLDERNNFGEFDPMYFKNWKK